MVCRKTITEIILKDRLEWELLTAILDAHPEESLHSPNSPSWASRDIYAHLARWINYSNQEMEAYSVRESLSLPINNAEELNLQWQQEDSRMTFQEARKKAQEAFNQRLRILQSIPLNRWDRDLEKIAHYDGAEHFAAHRSYIYIKKHP
jgi:hypothetical protein